ncbi:hypothetical protein GCM10007918_11010 [Piscinibacter gummiphilus]|nr:hypothetical protein GCM10007918_11010 [Piscinibacter gummiphilus]
MTLGAVEAKAAARAAVSCMFIVWFPVALAAESSPRVKRCDIVRLDFSGSNAGKPGNFARNFPNGGGFEGVL